MPALLLSPWFWLAMAVAAAGAMGKAWLDEHEAFASFRGAQEALARAAEERTANRIKSDKLNKGIADAKNQADRAGYERRIRELRLGSGADLVPAAPAGAGRADLACFDRAEFGRAVGDLVKEVRGLADEGAAATIDLDTAKAWARAVK